jgi:acyl-CoA thioester hydrolase
LTVIVPFDFEAQRPRRITADERAFLEEYRDDAPASEDEEAVAA